MNGSGADFNLVALHLDPRQARNPGDVDQQPRFAEAQLHQRDQAVAAGDQLSIAIGRAQLGQRVVDRSRAAVFEVVCDDAWPPWMMRHKFSGRSIMSMCFTPKPLKASTAALTTAGVAPRVPASPTPFAPSGFTGVGVTVTSSSNRGKSPARAIA